MIIKIHISATLKFQISKNVKFSDSMACDKKKITTTTTHCDILSFAGGSPLQPDTFHLWYSSSFLLDTFLLLLDVCVL